MEKSEEAIFNLINKKIQETEDLTENQKKRLIEIFGNRFNNAYRTLEEERVKKYVFYPSGRTAWIVVGRERDYQILPLANFCTCLDFYFRVISHENPFCYHLIAQKLAEALKRYIVIEKADVSFASLMEKWRKTVDRKRELSTADIKNVRKFTIEILIEEKELPIEMLLDRIREAGFNTLTARHLANILTADKAKRFKHANRLWKLSKSE